MSITNPQMIAGRFLRYARARQRVAWIKAQLAAGRIVQLTTYTKATSYDARHADMFKATKAGAFVQRGKSWDCIDFSNLQSFGPRSGCHYPGPSDVQ
jgi:hypothetical protein